MSGSAPLSEYVVRAVVLMDDWVGLNTIYCWVIASITVGLANFLSMLLPGSLQFSTYERQTAWIDTLRMIRFTCLLIVLIAKLGVYVHLSYPSNFGQLVSYIASTAVAYALDGYYYTGLVEVWQLFGYALNAYGSTQLRARAEYIQLVFLGVSLGTAVAGSCVARSRDFVAVVPMPRAAAAAKPVATKSMPAVAKATKAARKKAQ